MNRVKLVQDLKTLDYCNRFKALTLPSLYYQRARGEVIETYKYTHGIYKVDVMQIDLDCKMVVIRRHSMKLKCHACWQGNAEDISETGL